MSGYEEGRTLADTIEAARPCRDDAAGTEEYYDLVLQDACNDLRYLATCLKLPELRGKAETAPGDEFSLMEFHKTVLDAGSAPFGIAGEAVDGYIQSEK